MAANKCVILKRKVPQKSLRGKRIKTQVKSNFESNYEKVYSETVHKTRNNGYSK